MNESTSPPPDDFRAHPGLLRRMAAALDIQTKEVQERSHRLMDIFASEGPSRVAHPIDEIILQSLRIL